MSHAFKPGAREESDSCWYQDSPDDRGRGVTCGLPREAHDVVLRAREELDPDARMDAYYFGFTRTGVAAVDRILSEVARAGKAFHHTEEWSESYSTRGRVVSHEELIEEAAVSAANLVRELASQLDEARRQLAWAQDRPWQESVAG